MQTATSETEIKSLDLCICVHHYPVLGLHTTPLFGGRQGRATDKTPY